MSSLALDFLALIEKEVRFEYRMGGNTLVTYPHTTGWRVLPELVVCHVQYPYLIEFADKKPISARPGQALAIAPGVGHRLTMIKSPAGYSYWSHLNCEIFHGVSLFNLLEPPFLMSGKRALRIGEINRALTKVATAKPSLAQMVERQSLGWEMVRTLVEGTTLQESGLNFVRHASRLMPVLAHIEKHLAQPISNEALARAVALSPSRFHVVFRSALGCAPYEYVQKLRLRKAQQLLAHTHLSIAEIGQQVGHPDPFHFSRVFRRNFGFSPSTYRQQRLLESTG